jgi:hypothetical protein
MPGGRSYSGTYGEAVIDDILVGNIEGVFPVILYGKIIARIPLHPAPVDIARILKMPCGQYPETQGISRIYIVCKIVLQGQIIDAGVPVIILLQMGKKAIVIGGSQQGQIREEPVRVEVVPVKRGGAVCPVNTTSKTRSVQCFIVVLPPVDGKEEPVIGIDPVVKFQMQVRKMEIFDILVPILNGPDDIGAPPGGKERDVFLPDGTFQGKPR